MKQILRANAHSNNKFPVLVKSNTDYLSQSVHSPTALSLSLSSLLLDRFRLLTILRGYLIPFLLCRHVVVGTPTDGAVDVSSSQFLSRYLFTRSCLGERGKREREGGREGGREGEGEREKKDYRRLLQCQ